MWILLATCLWAQASQSFPLGLPVHVNQAESDRLPPREGTGATPLHLKTTGGDPYLVFPFPEGATWPEHQVLELTYFSTTGLDRIETRVMGQGRWLPPVACERLTIAEGPSVAVLPLTNPENFPSGEPTRKPNANPSQIRIDLGLDKDCDLQILDLKLRALTEQERNQRQKADRLRDAKAKRAQDIRAYLESSLDGDSITRIQVSESEVAIQGTFTTAGSVALAELDLASPTGAKFRANPILLQDENITREPDTQSPNFSLTLPRYHQGRDRLLSRWQLVTSKAKLDGQPRKWTPVGPARWASDVTPRQRTTATPPLTNAKGLNGISSRFGLDELVELGVQHIAINLVVADLLSKKKTAGAKRYEHAGQTWWANLSRLAEVDRQVSFATENDIQVAAIILIPIRSQDEILHPEAQSGGVYAMPNFTNAQAANKYSAAIRFLTERYSGLGPHGRVDHWIAHNEVDFAWQWTNMGRQPLEIMVDHYHRSMRVLCLNAEEFNPHAQVFVSLTHHFNDNHNDWKTYSSRRILEQLARYSAVEGDFSWGVAHHPYPPSLFHPLRWKPAQVLDSFDTPMITMKNIQVLKRFLKQPHFLDKRGRIRPVLLSEQGYHTQGMSQAEQELQGRALLYAWKRMRDTSFVLAFDYHRWVDHPREGGLQLGLRSYPTEQKVTGDKKLGWSVYQAIGTAEEVRWRRKLSPSKTALPDSP